MNIKIDWDDPKVYAEVLRQLKEYKKKILLIKRKIWQKEYSFKNRAKIIKQRQKHYQENREMYLLKSREYYKRNKDKIKIYNKKYHQETKK